MSENNSSGWQTLAGLFALGAGAAIGVGVVLWEQHQQAKSNSGSLRNYPGTSGGADRTAAGNNNGYVQIPETTTTDGEVCANSITPSNLTTEIDYLIGQSYSDQKKAYDILITCKELNYDYLWRLAQVCYKLAEEQRWRNQILLEEEYLEEGIQFSHKCLAIVPDSFFGNKWFAMNKFALHRLIKKSDDVDQIMNHINKALMKQSDPELHHLKGRLYYESDSSDLIELAINTLMTTEYALPQPWKKNKLMLAKCYLKLHNQSQAKYFLSVAQSLPNITEEDKRAQEEIDFLINDVILK